MSDRPFTSDAPGPPPAPDRRRGLLLAAGGVLILSLDALLVRLAAVDGWTVLFWRGVFMMLSLTLAAWSREGHRGLGGFTSPLNWLIALSFAGSTAAFVLSVLLTRVANTVVIISSAPLFAAIFSALFLREKVPPRTWAAIVVAFSGVLIVASRSLGEGLLKGDLLALANAVLMGASMTLLRRYPDASRTLILAASGALLALAALPFASPRVPGFSLLMLAIMGLAQMPLSLLLITDATRYLPAAEVTLFLLLETLLAPVWVWWFLGEDVTPATLFGGAVIVSTLIAHAVLSLRRGD